MPIAREGHAKGAAHEGQHSAKRERTRHASGDETKQLIFTLNAATGAVIRLVQGPSTGLPDFVKPDAISSDGTHVWVANPSGDGTAGFVTELNAATGAIKQLIH